jgi:hypothetical protein
VLLSAGGAEVTYNVGGTCDSIVIRMSLVIVSALAVIAGKVPGLTRSVWDQPVLDLSRPVKTVLKLKYTSHGEQITRDGDDDIGGHDRPQPDCNQRRLGDT